MAAADDESAAAREAAIASFAQKFPIDERAKDRLRCLPEDALRRVFDDFRPAADSNPDFSRRLVGFLKGFNTGNPFASLAPSLVGSSSLGLVESSSSVPLEQLELFRSSYPMDARAFDFLKIVPAEVQARVITTFKPPAVQADYSRIVTAHIRFCLNQHREQQQLANSHSVASYLTSQQQASASSLLAGTQGVSSLLGGLGGTQTLVALLGGNPGLAQLLGLAHPSTEAAEAAAAVAAIAAAAAPAENALTPEQLELFRASYPMDARAFDFLKIVPPEVQQRVIATFKPPAVQADYSRIVTSHIRFCLNQHREAQSSLQASAAPWLLGGAGTAAALLGQAGLDLSGAVLGGLTAAQDQLTVFRSTYPMDERAFDYLKMAPAEVQKRVISTFNPPAVQADYSKLVTAHVKFCLMQQREHTPPAAAQTAPQQATPQVTSTALVPAGGVAAGTTVGVGLAQLAAATQGMVSTRSSVSNEELEIFRSMYPMDDRAYDYLAGAPPEVQERVIDTFNVSEVQADYSRAVTAHVKFCLKQHKEQVPALIALPAGTDAAQAVTMLAEFRQKFPTDDRAWNYLLQSSAEVKQRVLTEFCPPAGVEGDYSKAVTAYIRRCRDDEKSRAVVPAVAAAAAAGDLGAVLGQGGLAALLRAQAAAAAAPAASWLGGDDGNAAKRLRTDVGPASSSFEQTALALTGAHWSAA